MTPIADFTRYQRMRQFIRELCGEYRISPIARRILLRKAYKRLAAGCNTAFIMAVALHTARRLQQIQGAA